MRLILAHSYCCCVILDDTLAPLQSLMPSMLHLVKQSIR